MRSPNSWDRSFRYGVSPHPEHAPENSNSGCLACDLLIEAGSIAVRSISGIDRKNSKFARSRSRWSPMGSMLIDLCRTSSLLRAGHTLTHTVHPVQSSGATWIASSLPGRSREANVFDWNDSGAASRSAGSNTFIRIAAWGHAMAHLPQSMQIDGSQ